MRTTLGVLMVLALSGCPVETPSCGDASCVDAPLLADVPAIEDAPRDTRGSDAPLSCGTAGRLGGACRDGSGATCETGAECQEELSGPTGEALTVATGLRIPQGEPDPDHVGFYRPVAVPDPANDIPMVAAPGGFCTQICDAALSPPTTAGAADMDCSDCSTCSVQVSTIGLLTTPTIYPAEMRRFGGNTGWCRADCRFDRRTNGGCPTGYTCSPSGNVCVEACTSDAECQFELVPQRNGRAVTIVDPSRGTCDTTTGRCSWPAPASAHVGDTCESSSDCPADVGACLRGGTCAVYDCGADPTTDPTTFNCDFEGSTANGVCIGNGDHFGSVCLAGCNSAADCNPGNACIPLGRTAGAFTGYCLGLCDTVMDGPSDVLWNCRSDERCDMPAATGSSPDPSGACRPFCLDDAGCDAARDERCAMVEGTTYGFCRVPDQICRVEVGDVDCHFDQVCDLLGEDGPDGLCVDRCATGADCDAGDECDTVRGVCRTPCPTGSECAPMVEACIAGYCEQASA